MEITFKELKESMLAMTFQKENTNLELELREKETNGKIWIEKRNNCSWKMKASTENLK